MRSAGVIDQCFTLPLPLSTVIVTASVRGCAASAAWRVGWLWELEME